MGNVLSVRVGQQFYGYSPNHITSNVAFMGCLMNDEAGARLLREKGIMENSFEMDQQLSRFFKNIGKDAAFDISESYLAEVFQGELAHNFFGSPWTSVATCAALVILGLTIIQTFFTVYSYFRIHGKMNRK
ncbi:hypothetical protein EUTSA_v10028028mg [Eutrema salsugineum]|uniref:Uncharacterized protein n=1 Tax=Eutrema salsugineum TaxID=72664 RepID=V4LUA5_EUTSA|nr:hypothetical protein EUTSA_v10028028mg [Eutrema salsugineum]